MERRQLGYTQGCVRGSAGWTVTRGLLAQLAKPDSSSGQGKDLAKRPGEEFVATKQDSRQDRAHRGQLCSARVGCGRGLQGGWPDVVRESLSQDRGRARCAVCPGDTECSLRLRPGFVCSCVCLGPSGC